MRTLWIEVGRVRDDELDRYAGPHAPLHFERFTQRFDRLEGFLRLAGEVLQ